MTNETQTVQTPPQTQKSLFNLSTAQQIVQLAITIASVVIIIAGLWIASQLSPLVQDIALVKQATADQDRRIEDMRSDITQIKINTDLTKNDVSEIKGLLQGNRPQSSTVTRTPVAQATPQPTTQVVYVPEKETIVIEKSEPQPTPEPTPEAGNSEQTPPGLVKKVLDIL